MKELTVKGGSLTYQIKEEQVQIESCHVREEQFTVPDRIEGSPVTAIQKKAFLGSKLLKELILPEMLSEAGDWAFAHCSALESVWLPKRQLSFGKGVFKDCGRLEHIFFLPKETDNDTERDKLAGLLAMVPVLLDADYLLDIQRAGEKDWLERLDARLLTLLEKPDEEGYLKQVLCGEEDLMASLELYLENRHKEKARLCYTRLLNDISLNKKMKEILQTYLRENTKGCAYEAAWELILTAQGQESEYCRILGEAGGFTEENFHAVLLDIGEDKPEMTAWLLRYREEQMQGEDFFAQFDL